MSRASCFPATAADAGQTRDPEQRWRLEELGGGIGAGIVPTEPPTDYEHAAAPVEDAIAVG